MGTFSCMLHRIVAAWRILVADEFIYMTRKHCVYKKDMCAGMEIKEKMTSYIQDSFDDGEVA